MLYNQRVDTLGSQTLQLRRLIMDLVYCYKIVFGLTCLDMNDSFKFSPTQATHGHPYKLFVPFTSRNCRQHFFSVHVIELWNSLKFKSDDFASVKRFKSALQFYTLSEIFQLIILLSLFYSILYFVFVFIISVLCKRWLATTL